MNSSACINKQILKRIISNLTRLPLLKTNRYGRFNSCYLLADLLQKTSYFITGIGCTTDTNYNTIFMCNPFTNKGNVFNFTAVVANDN